MYKMKSYGEYFTENKNAKYITVKSGSKVYGDFDYEIHYDEERDCIQINFQCTNGNRDWITNLSYVYKPYDAFTHNGRKLKIKVHHGWMEMYKLGRNDIRQKFAKLREEHPDCEIEIIGWSLGGAMAQLCAQDLSFNFCVVPILFTYGSPKPWYGKRTYQYVKECIDERSQQFDNSNDIVTYVPPFPGWYKMKHSSVGLEKFNVIKVFNPLKFHTMYDNEKLYR